MTAFSNGSNGTGDELVITHSGFEAIRIAATMTHLFPTLSTRVRDAERLLVEVAWPPAPPPEDSALAVDPCSFRQRVAAAWSDHQMGRESSFLGIGADLLVEMRAAVGGVVWPSGIVRLPLFDRWVYAFGSSLDPDACQELGADILDDFDPPPGSLGVRIHGDAGTQITVVSAEVDADPRLPAEPAVLQLLHGLIARYAATDLIDRLSGDGSGPRFG
jgi:hypothetical protein